VRNVRTEGILGAAGRMWASIAPCITGGGFKMQIGPGTLLIVAVWYILIGTAYFLRVRKIAFLIIQQKAEQEAFDLKEAFAAATRSALGFSIIWPIMEGINSITEIRQAFKKEA
jgi:hypothetical protein